MSRRLADLPLLVILMGIAALSMYVPAFHAMVLKEYHVGRAFLYSGSILLMLVGMIAIVTVRPRSRGAAYSNLVALVGAYLVLPLMLAVPLSQRGAGSLGFGDAWFEMVSAFTTTGATLLQPKDLPQSSHLWRAMVGWAGGFFVIVMALAVLMPLNLGGVEATSDRTPGRRAAGTGQFTYVADPTDRIRRFASDLFPAYAALTLLLWIGLMLSGDTSFVALCHAMSTLSTSGISPIGGVASGQGGFMGEVLIVVFLIPALSAQVLGLGSGRRGQSSLQNNGELRLAAVLLFAVPTVLFLHHWVSTTDVETTAGAIRVLWSGLFMAMSFLTTTAFESADWQEMRIWSGIQTPGMLLMALAILGGGVATSAGGVKLLRVLALFQHGQAELGKLVHPNAVGGTGSGQRQGLRQGAFAAWVFFMLFATSIAIVTALLTLLAIDFDKALVLAIAALTLSGPLAGMVGTMSVSYAGLGGDVLSVLGVAMVVGRLETLAILTLLAPDSWRR